MSATDELRRMLDERGVQYETDDTQVSDTEWYYVTKLRDGYSDGWIYEEPPECDLLMSYPQDLGAEDAIAATLGAGTCYVVCSDDYSYMPPTWHLSCGHTVQGNERPNYCSNCGKRVVE